VSGDAVVGHYTAYSGQGWGPPRYATPIRYRYNRWLRRSPPELDGRDSWWYERVSIGDTVQTQVDSPG